MRKSRLTLFSTVIIIFALSVMNIFAAGSNTITYQGTVLKPDGKPPKDDYYNMRFSFWNMETGGTEELNRKWVETRDDTNAIYVKDGCFSVELGRITSFPENLFKDNPLLWLQIEIDINQNGIFEPDEVFAIRAAMTATPYAFQSDNATTATFSQNAATIEGKQASDFAITGHSHYYLDAEDGDPTKAVYVDNDGNVGIGTNTPSNALDVNGTIKANKYVGLPGTPLEIESSSSSDVNIKSGKDVNIEVPNSVFSLHKGGGPSTDGAMSIDMTTGNVLIGIGDPELNSARLAVLGKVGIGTTDPGCELDINGTINIQGYNSLHFSQAGINNAFIVENYGLELQGSPIHPVQVINASLMVGYDQTESINRNSGDLYTSGSIGIGTTSPSEKLEVNGAVKLGDTATTNPGTIRWTGTDFEGYNGSEWVSLTMPSSGGVVPKGAIIMWSGEINDIPQGWLLCNGNNNTPDLSDRFILGVTQSSTANVGDCGPTSHAGGGAIFGSGNDIYYKTSGYVDGSAPGVRNDYQQTNPVQSHKHEFMPRYYALAYIMKE